MNYIEQIKGFWITQEINQLGTSEIAMYFHLLEIWNRTGWIGNFKRNNYKVMADLSIRSPKTLQSVRDRLQSAGILVFKTKNGDANCEYQMLDLGKFYRGRGLGEGVGKGVGKGVGSGIDNINQTKPNETFSFAGEPAPVKPDLPKKDRAKKDDPTKLPYWAAFVEVWETFYLQQTKEKYLYMAKDFGCLKKIYQFLQKRSETKKLEFNQKNLVTAFQYFLDLAYKKDEWLRSNFSIPNVLSQFNQISNEARTEFSKKQQQQTGANVSTGSILAKISAMPDQT